MSPGSPLLTPAVVGLLGLAWRTSSDEMRNYRLCLLFFVILAAAASVTPFKDEKYYEQDIMREVTQWMEQAARAREASLCGTTATKRNSEIINSLLGLPKNLNDVGRK